MKKSLALFISASFLALISTLCLVYFFEDLPIEIEVERWEQLHPGRYSYYQQGLMHNIVDNFSCNVLHGSPCAFLDAAYIYRCVTHCYPKSQSSK